MTGVASASENRSFKASEGRLYAAALSGALTASLLIASPLLYLIFVAIIAFRDRVRINALMHQRVVALNLAPHDLRLFRTVVGRPLTQMPLGRPVVRFGPLLVSEDRKPE